MQFVKDGNVLKVIKVTGPSHNFLGLVICKADEKTDFSDIEIKELEIPTNSEKLLRSDDIKQQVEDAVCEVNHLLNSRYKVKQIQFIPSDTPDPKIYKELAKEIILRMHQGENF